MIRVLVMIAVAGFVLAVVCISSAVAIGGPQIVAQGGWPAIARHWTGDWDFNWEDGEPPSWSKRLGPQATRTIAWSGADALDIDLPADVRYVQQEGAPS